MVFFLFKKSEKIQRRVGKIRVKKEKKDFFLKINLKEINLKELPFYNLNLI